MTDEFMADMFDAVKSNDPFKIATFYHKHITFTKEEPLTVDLAKKEAGLIEIETAQWEKVKETSELKLTVTCSRGFPCDCYISPRRYDCDRGHIMFLIDGHLSIDEGDSFPRYFFSFEEADAHVRTFLKWRLWKHRTNSNVERNFK